MSAVKRTPVRKEVKKERVSERTLSLNIESKKATLKDHQMRNSMIVAINRNYRKFLNGK